MGNSGNYPVYVYAGKDGEMHIGAKSCKSYDDVQQIYGTQIPHRCVAYDQVFKKHQLVTPTEVLSAPKRYIVTDSRYVGYTMNQKLNACAKRK